MTNTLEPAMYLDFKEARAMGIRADDEIGVFMSVEDATMVLLTTALGVRTAACRDTKCDACAAISRIWWSMFYALPIPAANALGETMQEEKLRAPVHAVHNPR